MCTSICSVHNSLITHNNMHQIVFRYFDLLYIILFISIKSSIKSAQKIVNNLINENIFRGNQFMSKHILHIQNRSIYTCFNSTSTFAHMLNENEICFKRTNYRIFNIQNIIDWLCTSTLDCFC